MNLFLTTALTPGLLAILPMFSAGAFPTTIPNIGMASSCESVKPYTPSLRTAIAFMSCAFTDSPLTESPFETGR